MKASVQLYSLRDEVERLGIDAVLKEVKESGFDAVETAGFYGLTAKAFSEKVLSLGLEVSGMHLGLDDILNTDVINKSAAVGFKNAIVPCISYLDFCLDFENVVEKMRRALEVCQREGLTLLYHNHAHEYYGGEDFVLKMCKRLPALKAQLDIFWVVVGGKRLVDYYPLFEGRCNSFHIKELGGEGIDDFSPLLGEGFARCEEAKSLAKQEGFEYLTLEFEKINVPFNEYLKHSARFLKQ